jgi:uncharacterized protein (DUF2236 family)
MQVAHPLVAAGVGEHSCYREDPWGRLYRTIDLYTSVIFGSQAQADDASRRLWALHGRVHGVTRHAGGRFAAGTPYAARDPDLLLWVHATMVDTDLLVFERYLGTLTSGGSARYYEEQKLLAERFGLLPRERQPATLVELGDYVQTMLGSDALAVTPVLSDVADAVLHPPAPFIARPAMELVKLVTVGLLPTRLRRELGLTWTPAHEVVLAASRHALSTLIPRLPSALRAFPRAGDAEARVRAVARAASRPLAGAPAAPSRVA